MKHYFWMGMVLALLLILTSSLAPTTVNATTTSEADIPSEQNFVFLDLTPQKWVLVNSNDINVLNVFLKEAEDTKVEAHNMAEAARGLGYPGDHPIIKLAQQEYLAANEVTKYYKHQIKTLEEELIDAAFELKRSEYPAAAFIWEYLHEQGLNDHVTSGIIGNLMTEVGGQTLDIQYTLQNKTYYGMIQWNKKYFPGVIGKDLQGQCEFLMSNIEETFHTYGKNYKSGFDYEDFCNLTNEKDAALAFAKIYERCGSGSYEQRKKNATVAYEYFMGD